MQSIALYILLSFQSIALYAIIALYVSLIFKSIKYINNMHSYNIDKININNSLDIKVSFIHKLFSIFNIFNLKYLFMQKCSCQLKGDMSLNAALYSDFKSIKSDLEEFA